MPRTTTLVRALAAVLVIAAILVPAASADPNPKNAPVYWSYDYQAPIPHPRAAQAVKTDTGTDNTGAVIAVVLAGACLLLGAVTVLPRRRRATV
jgi:hypothetical protein